MRPASALAPLPWRAGMPLLEIVRVAITLGVAVLSAALSYRRTSTPCDRAAPAAMRPTLQIGNLQGAAQLLSKAAGSLSGTAADLLSPARMVLIGTLLTTLCKPMFALRCAAAAALGAKGVRRRHRRSKQRSSLQRPLCVCRCTPLLSPRAPPFPPTCSGWVHAAFGLSAALAWVSFAKASGCCLNAGSSLDRRVSHALRIFCLGHCNWQPACRPLLHACLL